MKVISVDTRKLEILDDGQRIVVKKNNYNRNAIIKLCSFSEIATVVIKERKKSLKEIRDMTDFEIRDVYIIPMLELLDIFLSVIEYKMNAQSGYFSSTTIH